IDRAHDPRSWARSHVILTELPKLSHHAPCAREYGTGRAEPLTLDRHDLQVLAGANALRSLAGDNRRDALWLAAAAVPDRDLLRGTECDDAAPALPRASEGHEIVTDYRAMGFTLGRHPLALLRDRLALDHLQSAEQLATLRSGQLARACGLVVSAH
ncbi:hypothetical protein SB380_38480, partial [Burkholderia cenocepacia]|nr:hypothetical protein [Burkholderia cenocepacia]